MPIKNKKLNWLRTIIQIAFLSVVILVSINHYRVSQGLAPLLVGSPSFHSICPFGGVVTAYHYFTEGIFIRQTHQSSFTLMWLVLLLTLFFGPVFCGWVCPIGTVQEFVGKIGRKIFPKKYNQFIPKKIDYWLRYLRYLVLISIVILTAQQLRLVFQDYCPYFNLFSFWSSEVTVSAVILLGIIFVGSLFVERPWCKYLCPLGALLGIFNLFRIIPLRRNDEIYINCRKCDRVCPMNIKISDKKVIRDHQCISCLLCTDEASCPVEGGMEFAFLRNNKDVNKDINRGGKNEN